MLKLQASGEELRLGGHERPRVSVWPRDYGIEADGSILVYGAAENRTHCGLFLRGEGGAPRLAYCRPMARLASGSPETFRDASEATTWLADRDIRSGGAYLVSIRDDGTVSSEGSAKVFAGPWVHEGRVFWQPDSSTLCEGARLGEPERTHEIAPEHAGAGRLLRMRGRFLFLPFHGVSILDLTPAKKGKIEISRKHKARDEQLYASASKILAPLRRMLAPRGASIDWAGCTRRGSTVLAPVARLSGRSDAMTHVVGMAVQHGAPSLLARHGATSISVPPFGSVERMLDCVVTADDIRAYVAAVDEAGLARAPGLSAFVSVGLRAKERGAPMPLTRDAEELVLSATLSGLRGVANGEIPPLVSEALLGTDAFLSDDRHSSLPKVDIAQLVLLLSHRLLGADAAHAAPWRAWLSRMPLAMEQLDGLLSLPAARPE